jgi:nucleoside-diphosphate-sugar epimerase
MCALYLQLIDTPARKISGEIFNAGYQNHSIAEIAEIVRGVVTRQYPDRPPITIETTPSDDPRSYHINTDKIRRVLGFVPQFTIEDAVRDLCVAFKAGKIPDSMALDGYFNVRRMKAIGAV